MTLNKKIKSPINYTGNKYQIIEEILSKINTSNKIVVDMFSGGSTVGINIQDAKQVYMIEKNKNITTLLNLIGEVEFEKLIYDLNKLIKKYNLSNSFEKGTNYYSKYRIDNNGLKYLNEKGYKLLKENYNKRKNKFSKKAIEELYLLIIYGFNNDIRFNKSGEFNLPCGKTDFNKNNYYKLKDFNSAFKKKNHKILNLDVFSKEALSIYELADIIYIDPPYLITKATYNENNSWTNKEEQKLLKTIDELVLKGKKVYLSNVLEIDGKKNEILNEWCLNNKNNIKIHKINKHYRSASYNKKVRGNNKEVLIEVKIENK